MDLVTHWNLLNPKHVRAFQALQEKLKPNVSVMAMPCTGFSVLLICFAKTHPESFKRALKEGTALAIVATIAARQQLLDKRHFIAENPKESKIWDLKIWNSYFVITRSVRHKL